MEGTLSGFKTVIAGDTVTLIEPPDSSFYIWSSSTTYGKKIFGSQLPVKGSVRIKLSYYWDISSGNTGNVHITAINKDMERLIKTAQFTGTSGSHTNISIDVSGIQDWDIVRINIKHPYGTSPTFYLTGIFCDYL